MAETFPGDDPVAAVRRVLRLSEALVRSITGTSPRLRFLRPMALVDGKPLPGVTVERPRTIEPTPSQRAASVARLAGQLGDAVCQAEARLTAELKRTLASKRSDVVSLGSVHAPCYAALIVQLGARLEGAVYDYQLDRDGCIGTRADGNPFRFAARDLAPLKRRLRSVLTELPDKGDPIREHLASVFGRLRSGLEQELDVLPPSNSSPARPSATEAFFDGRAIHCGENTVRLTDDMATLIGKLIARGAVSRTELTDCSRYDEPAKALKTLIKNHPCLGPHICFPKNRSGGGYSTTIRDCRQNATILP